MALPFVQDQPNEANYQGLVDRLPVSQTEQLETTFKSSFSDALTSRTMDHFAIQAAEKQPNQQTLSVDDLQKRYDGLGISWDGPKKEAVAEIIANKRRDDIYAQQKIESGPDGYASKGLNFGAGLVAHMVDPIELGLTMGTAGLGRMAIAARYGATALEGAGLLTKVGLGLAEGAATQAALEPAITASDREFQRDWGATETLKRVAFGALMGAGLEAGGHLVGGLLGKMMKTNVHVEAQDAAIWQAVNDKETNIAPFTADFARERSGYVNSVKDYGGRANYDHPFFDPKNPEGAKVYHGTTAAVENFKDVSEAGKGGEGWTDHGGIANGDAASKWNQYGVVGNVFEKELAPTARIISADQPMGHNEQNLLNNAISNARRGDTPAMGGDRVQTAFEGLAKDIRDGQRFSTLNELIDHAEQKYDISEKDVIHRIEPELEKAGFHGMHIYDEERGVNRFEFFQKALDDNGSKDAPLFKNEETYKGDTRLVPEPTVNERQASIEKAMSPESDLTPYSKTDTAGDAELKQVMDMAPKDDLQMEDMAKGNESDQMKEIQDMREAGQLQPKDEAELDSFKDFDKMVDGFHKAMKLAYNCVLGNG